MCWGLWGCRPSHVEGLLSVSQAVDGRDWSRNASP